MSPSVGHSMSERIITARKLRRMTQAQLADAAAISVSLLRKIEQGSRPATPAVWSSIARTLGLDNTESADGARSAGSRVSAAIPHIRCALDCYDLPDDGPIAPLADFRAATEQVTVRRLAAHYTRLAETIPELITELTRAAHGYTGHDQESVFGLLALAYRAADALCDKFGYPDLSARTIELMRWAAARSGDPMLAGVAAYVRAETFFSNQRPAAGLRALEAASSHWPLAIRVRRWPFMDRCTCARVSWLLALACQRSAPRIWPRRATSAVTCLTPLTTERPSVRRAYGYTSWRRLPRWGTARSCSAMPPDGSHRSRCLPSDAPTTSSSWRARSFGPDVAMMRSLRSDAARRIAPQHTRHNPRVHETARTLMRLHRHPRDTLLGFARWAGIGK